MRHMEGKTDYSTREMEERRQSPRTWKGKGTDRTINKAPSSQGGRMGVIPLSQQEVLHSGALEIEEDKRLACLQWERYTQQEEAQNP